MQFSLASVSLLIDATLHYERHSPTPACEHPSQEVRPLRKIRMGVSTQWTAGEKFQRGLLAL